MGNWEAKIYINETFKSSIIVDNSTSLSEIRNKINLNNNNDYYFISRKDGLIENEEGFNAKKV